MVEDLIPVLRALSERFSNYELAYVRSDIEQDIGNLRNAAAMKKKTILFLTHRCGSWLAPLDVTLTWNTWPHAAFRNEDYVRTAKFYVLELDAPANYNAEPGTVYGEVRSIDGKDVAALVSAYTVNYDEAVVTYVEDGSVRQKVMPRDIAIQCNGPDVKEVTPLIDKAKLEHTVFKVADRLHALSVPLAVKRRAS